MTVYPSEQGKLCGSIHLRAGSREAAGRGRPPWTALLCQEVRVGAGAGQGHHLIRGAIW